MDEMEGLANSGSVIHNVTKSLHSNGSRMLLIVEDNETLQLFLRTVLQRLRIPAMFAASARDALSLFNAHCKDIEIVFMDWNLPDMDGLECAQLMHEQYPAMPIVALTAHASSEHRDMCFKAGLSDYLSKPFTSDQFIAMVTRWSHRDNRVSA